MAHRHLPLATDATAMGARIRELRQDRGWTQADLAERVGLAVKLQPIGNGSFYRSSWTIGRWETGRGRPRGKVLERLALVFGVSWDYLVTGE